MGNAAVTGTPTSTGGAITPSSQNQTLTIDGYPIALIGDIATCGCGLPYCKKMGPIVANPATPRAVFYGNIPWALAGDLVETGCGLCTILESAHDVMVGPELSSPVHIPAGIIMKIVSGMTFNMGPRPAPPPSALQAAQAARATATMATSTAGSATTHGSAPAPAAQAASAAQSAASAHAANQASAAATDANKTAQKTAAPHRQMTADGWQIVQGISPDQPLLVYQTERKMNDMHAADLQHGDESKAEIMAYGWQHPFEDKLNLKFNHAGFINQAEKEDQFTLPAEEHFRRMRNLGDHVFLNFGFSTEGETKDVFSKMFNKFKRNEGGTFSDDILTDAMKKHKTTNDFHKALKTCLRQNINPDGNLPSENQIQAISSDYLANKAKVSLPKFNIDSETLFNGTVLSVHDIWAMQVYITQLEYKGEQIRGIFHYKIEDHFGLNSGDINHPNFKSSLDINHPIDTSIKMGKEMAKKFEILDGFRSWYILQHYQGYNYKPFTTQMDFSLK